MDTTAIIQFIGLVLFSASVHNDPGVHAILPRIDSPAMHAEHTVSPGDAHRPGEENPDAVENHVAVIIYRHNDLISRSREWKIPNKTLDNGWEFVELDGEQVQFLTNKRNSEPKIPDDLPLAIAPDSVCPVHSPQPIELNDAFQAPNFKGAVAVVRIPDGRLSACTAHARGDANRVDTTLLMDTGGVLVITGKKTTETRAKTLTLAGDAIVYVANVPPRYLATGVAEPPPGMPHWEAYASMLDSPCHSAPERTIARETCDLTPINTAWRTAQASPPSPQWKIFDSSCSNTQWP